MQQREARVMVIEGRRVLVTDRTPPIPGTLDVLLAEMRVTLAADVKPSGTRSVCISDQDHRLRVFREGRHVGRDGVVRDLRLLMCADCESVCVRDISRDRLAGLSISRLPRRRDHVIGWYSGSRPANRVYVPM